MQKSFILDGRNQRAEGVGQRYDGVIKFLCIAQRNHGMGFMRYNELIGGNAREFEVREFLSKGVMTAIAIRIPKNLKDAAVESAAGKKNEFSAFIRMCMIEELTKRDLSLASHGLFYQEHMLDGITARTNVSD